MIKVFKNIYQCETLLEKIDKKCCKSVSPYVIKCEGCQGIVCFQHVKTAGKGNSKRFVCYLCIWSEDEEE